MTLVLNDLNSNHLWSHMVSDEAAYLDDSSSVFLSRLQWRCQLELQLFEALTRMESRWSWLLPNSLAQLLAGGFGCSIHGPLHRTAHHKMAFLVNDPKEREAKTEAILSFIISSQKWHNITSAIYYCSHRPTLILHKRIKKEGIVAGCSGDQLLKVFLGSFVDVRSVLVLSTKCHVNWGDLYFLQTSIVPSKEQE